VDTDVAEYEVDVTTGPNTATLKGLFEGGTRIGVEGRATTLGFEDVHGDGIELKQDWTGETPEMEYSLNGISHQIGTEYVSLAFNATADGGLGYKGSATGSVDFGSAASVELSNQLSVTIKEKEMHEPIFQTVQDDVIVFGQGFMVYLNPVLVVTPAGG
jgi:hypothetical protein